MIENQPLAAQIFAGNGELAGLIREMDWASTPLGPVETWPQSLRTAVSICLGSRHPIVLWWGPERWMFYNDGYRPMLGETKHPQFLGRSGKACWAEIWDIIGPMMEEVLATGEATWSEDLFLLMERSGYLEETYFTFSYSPIRDESGTPSGIFNACTESTARVLADRRMKTLREMTVDARTVADAARKCAEILGRNDRDIPFALLYLQGPEGADLGLAASSGLEPGSPATDARNWPLARVAGEGRAELVTGLGERFELPRAPWDEPAHEALLLPIVRPGTDRAAGVLVLGINPRRALDDDYRGFFELVAARISTALASASAFEEERERAEKLAELDRAKTDFFSNVSHEFRTPLTLILGPLEDALREPGRALVGDGLEAVHRSALRLLRLVNSLLDFSRVEAGRVESWFEPTDLSRLTAGLAGAFQSLVESGGLALVIDCPPLDEPIYVDRSQWEKIVLNLVSNAFKFTFDGSITVRLRQREDRVELSVIDTGTGIAPDQVPRVFERFHRVEGARGRSFEGTGIGLALVRELVRQHGGEVSVDSVVGRGTAFVVAIPTGTAHLPADRVAAGIGGEAASGVSPYLLEASQWVRGGTAPVEIAEPRGARILVADDNADMREYLLRLLSPHWTVEVVVDGQAALESVLERRPDLLISDVMMPRMDGVTLLRTLRADTRTRTVPIILLSARAGEDAVVGGLATGADDYLVKPFSARELLTRVRTHLEMARIRRAAADEVERKNRELEAFSYSVSHDLRAPLRTVDGFSQALLEDYAEQLGPRGQDYLRRVRAAGRRMGELIDDLLELSRVERSELRHADVDLSGLGARIGEALGKGAPERNVELLVTDGLVARGDPRLLEILLENLLGNAWKFTSKAASARVELGRIDREGETAFFVRDNGAGFDPEYGRKLFVPFQRLHSVSEFPGTGIGLATVKRIVDRHGGRVWAEGKINGGAAVYFTLPAAR